MYKNITQTKLSSGSKISTSTSANKYQLVNETKYLLFVVYQ